MKKAAIIIAVLVVVPLLVILGYAATKSDTMIVLRSTIIKAPPEKIFPLIDDFHRWEVWSPYEKLDPALKRTFSGATSGPGAIYAWSGNSQVGEGRMEIGSTTPPSRIMIKLEFIRPFAGTMNTLFRLDKKGESTDVTWAMRGPQSYMGKIMSVFIDCDAMIGKDFETGLANLKAIAEKEEPAETAAKPETVEPATPE